IFLPKYLPKVNELRHFILCHPTLLTYHGAKIRDINLFPIGASLFIPPNLFVSRQPSTSWSTAVG
ncbi:MAG: hypothetical protein LBL58_12345, partial [Tannerellaceae bacterium]|nr:hypothetical protein [Tannerellaceae bacterium]